MKEKNIDKPLFFQRFIAFIIDFLLVTFASSLLSTPFVDTEKTAKIEEQIPQILERYTSGETTTQEYFLEYSNMYYQLSKNSGAVSIITLFLSVCYFVVFQFHHKGQTLGKKWMKIKVVSTDDKLNMDQMVFRSLIANFILVELIQFASLIFSPKSVYFYIAFGVEMIQYVIVIISVFMILFGREGLALHDKLAHTKVIKEK